MKIRASYSAPKLGQLLRLELVSAGCPISGWGCVHSVLCDPCAQSVLWDTQSALRGPAVQSELLVPCSADGDGDK
jgi:hypothetical protein